MASRVPGRSPRVGAGPRPALPARAEGLQGTLRGRLRGHPGGASLQDIADQFGVLKGSLFHYIETKDELLLEIIEGVYEDAAREVWVVAQEEDTALNRLRRMTVAYAVFISRNLDEVTVWVHD